MRRVVVFDYDSRFCPDIARVIDRYNKQFPDRAFVLDIYKAVECPFESVAGAADFIIHSGGDGEPVWEDVRDVRKLYICHSHQWKAKKSGGELARVSGVVTGIQPIDVLEDDEILGKKGRMEIMKYHSLVVTRPPAGAKVLAKSRIPDGNGGEIEVIEALRYPDGSVSVQGHPEEGAASHIFYNLLKTEG